MSGVRGAAALASVATLLATGVASATGVAGSGLVGIVTRGPTRPVCQVDEPCDAPAQVTLVFSRRGHVVARVRSSTTGHYRISLAPATYVVRTTAPAFERVVKPPLVRVPHGRYARVDFSIDTGIR